MSLDEFLAAEAAKPFAWALNDCTMMCDRWVRIRCGVSPVEAGPITYGDHAGAIALLPHLPQVMNRAMRKAGLSKTLKPVIGDIGLILFDGRCGPALLAGNLWVTRHEDGFIAVPRANVWKVWSLCGQV